MNIKCKQILGGSALSMLVAGCLLAGTTYAEAPKAPEPAKKAEAKKPEAKKKDDQKSDGNEIAQIKGILKNLIDDNNQFVKSHNPDYYKPFLDGQKPRATVVTCSDSRVHTHALDSTPDGDLFMVRNIGNQLSTAEGSVEYGVHHLHTPLLIFIGHSACGAIQAASGDYTSLSNPIKKELDTIKIAKGTEITAGVIANVQNQVGAALKKFNGEVREGKLTVMGAVYDFRNDLKQGNGKLVVININGETDPAKVSKHALIAGK